jgi:hypothetical protein
MTALSYRNRRALWLGMLVIAPVIAWRAVGAPYAAAVERAEARADASADLLAREQALLRDGPRLPATLAASRLRLERVSSGVFAVADTSDAATALALWLRTAAHAAGLREFHADPAPASHLPGGLVGIQVDVRAQGETAALVAWLTRVERGSKLLPIERLEISSAADGTLSISARVRAFALGGAQ